MSNTKPDSYRESSSKKKILSTRLSRILGQEMLASDAFQRAIRHRSRGGKHNERMEFLGDSVLGFVISSQLYSQLPDASEGYLSRLRASLVNENTLAEIANELSLGEHLLLGPGELKSGGFRRKSILADAVEAVIASIFIEQGTEAAQSFILELYQDKLQQLPSEHDLKDPKSRLQELLQSRNYPLPTYQLLETTGEAHKQVFTCQCEIPALDIQVKGVASSRKKAEQKAADNAYQVTVKILKVKV